MGKDIEKAISDLHDRLVLLNKDLDARKQSSYTSDLDNELPKRRLVAATFENEDGSRHSFELTNKGWKEVKR